MAKLNESIVSVNVDGDVIALKCNLRNVQIVNQRFGGLVKAQTALREQDFDSIAMIIMECGGLRQSEKKDFPERLYRNGITQEILLELFKFTFMLYNGGRLPDMDDDAAPAEESAEGNA